jgi:glycerol-3-phosphate acyltransferase PlsY
MYTWLFYLIGAYLVGCFCGAYYYGKLVKKIDLREHGSGNLGATNTGRVFGATGFTIVFLLDLAKAVIVVLVGRSLGLSDIALMLGICAVIIGHMYPAQLQFKGGIGVASYIGGLIAYSYIQFAILLVMALILFGITRKKTRSGFIAMLALPFIVFIVYFPNQIAEPLLLLGLTVFIMVKHGK